MLKDSRQIRHNIKLTPFNPGKYRVSVKVAPGYALISDTATMPDAVLEFDRLTDGKYQLA